MLTQSYFIGHNVRHRTQCPTKLGVIDHGHHRHPTTRRRLDVPVLIVGAGPAGLVTAIGLARQGVRSMVIERHPSTSIFPRATGVSLRSMEIFRGWGIDDEIRRGGWRVKPSRRDRRGRLADPHARRVAARDSPDEAASAASARRPPRSARRTISSRSSSSTTGRSRWARSASRPSSSPSTRTRPG